MHFLLPSRNRKLHSLQAFFNKVEAKRGVLLMQPSQVPDISVSEMSSKGHWESNKLVGHDFFHFFHAQKEFVISVRKEIVVPLQRAQIICIGWDVCDFDLDSLSAQIRPFRSSDDADLPLVDGDYR